MVRPERRTRLVGRREEPQPFALDVRRHAGDAVDAHLHLATYDVGGDGRTALVRHVGVGEARHRAQMLEGEVREAALAIGRHRELAWIRLCVAHHLADGLERRIWVCHDREVVEGRHRDRREVLERVVGDVLAGVRQHHHVAALHAGDGVAVGG